MNDDEKFSLEQFAQDAAKMQRRIGDLLEECCRIYEDLGFKEGANCIGGWIIEFRKDPEADANWKETLS